MDTEKVLLETYRKWSDETLIRAMSTFTRDGGVARKPYLQALRERGLDLVLANTWPSQLMAIGQKRSVDPTNKCAPLFSMIICVILGYGVLVTRLVDRRNKEKLWRI